jgi:hypothetical protein
MTEHVFLAAVFSDFCNGGFHGSVAWQAFVNPLMLELNPSAQCCVTRFICWGFCFLNHAFH